MSNYITVRKAVQMMIDGKIANMTFEGLNTENVMKHLELDCKSRLARLAEVGKGTGVKGNAVKYRFSRDGYDPDKIRINIADEDTQRPLWSLFIMLSSFATEETPLVEVEKEVEQPKETVYINTTNSTSNLKGTQIMTKMLLTIISCVFLCVACSDADYDNDYYEQQIDESYDREITAETELANLHTQLEETNTAEASNTEEINTTDADEEINTVTVDEETNVEENNTTNVITSCIMDDSGATKVLVALLAQLDDVLQWNDISENSCENASAFCVQQINVTAEVYNDPTHISCAPWNCGNNDCSATTHVLASNCDADTIETVKLFYSTTHLPCAYRFDDLLK